MSVQAITLDLPDVLYRDTPERIEARLQRRVDEVVNYFAARRITVEPEPAREALEEFDSLIGLAQPEIGQYVAVRLINKKLAEQHTMEIGELVSLAGLRHPPLLLDGATDALAMLAAQWPIGLIVDTHLTLGREISEFLRADGVSRHLKHATYADATLSDKREQRNFLYTMAMLGVSDPTQVVHVSAAESPDIRTARLVGMRTVRLGAPSQPGNASGNGDHGGDESHADAAIAHLAALPALLQSWARG